MILLILFAFFKKELGSEGSTSVGESGMSVGVNLVSSDLGENGLRNSGMLEMGERTLAGPGA